MEKMSKGERQAYNRSLLEQMVAKYPHWDYAVCGVCDLLCVLWEDGEPYHKDCVGTDKWRRIKAKERRNAPNTAATLFS